jgi:transposase
VIVTHRPKYSCRACAEAVVQAPAPERLIKGGLPTPNHVRNVSPDFSDGGYIGGWGST